MVLIIDAVNLKSGGGILHLSKILEFWERSNTKFKKIVVIGPSNTIKEIPNNKFIFKINSKWASRSILLSAIWQKFILPRIVLKYKGDLIFNPNGTYFGKTKVVLMSHNMLIHDRKSRKKYGHSILKYKFDALDKIQSKAFIKSDGIIFISNYAKNYISNKLNLDASKYPVIHHGVEQRFKTLPKSQSSIAEYNSDKLFTFLYVSNITVYKHHLEVVRAIIDLKSKGYPIKLILVGGLYPPYFRKIEDLIKTNEEYIEYKGIVNHHEMHDIYNRCNALIFASSCENMPNILIEGMSSGKPIICSNKEPMPEFLDDAGFYFNPEDEKDISEKIESFLLNPLARERNAKKAFQLSEAYNWADCSKKTFGYFEKVIE